MKLWIDAGNTDRKPKPSPWWSLSPSQEDIQGCICSEGSRPAENNGHIFCFEFFFFHVLASRPAAMVISCVLSFSSLIFLADDRPALYPFILFVCLFVCLFACLLVFKSTCSRTMSEPSTAWLPALGCVKILWTPTTRLQKEGRPQKKKNYFAPQ